MIFKGMAGISMIFVLSFKEGLRKVVFITLRSDHLPLFLFIWIINHFLALFEKDVFLPLEKLKTLAPPAFMETSGGLMDPLGGVIYMKNFYGLELLKNHI